MGKGWKTSIKAENAAKKGQMFTKFAREIQVAAKAGGPDPTMNARLRLAIDAAKKNSCPNDTIDRAIKKGAGILESALVEEVAYEGYGPHGVGVIVECQTDNRHRTAPDIRNAFKKHDGNMGESGSVAWMFERVGLIEGSKAGNFDPEEEAIEAGANEVEKEEDDGYSFYSSIEDMDTVRQNLQKRGWQVTTCELSYKAKNITELSAEQMKDVEKFLQALDDMDDTHRVYATI